LEDAVRQDVALTATGTIAFVAGKVRYPLVWTIAGVKEWSEHSEVSFRELLNNGWDMENLEEGDFRKMLKIVMVGGEARRALFDGEPRAITDELVEEIFDLCHPSELMLILTTLWNEPPAREPDPPKATE
jgi:hypothetical protein